MIKQFKGKKERGFTLVELIAVIAIIGILSAIIVPMVGKYTTQAKVAKAKEEMRQFVMAVETAGTETGVLSSTVDAVIVSGMAASGIIGPAANEIVPMNGLTKIQRVSFTQAKTVVNGTMDLLTVQPDGTVDPAIDITSP